MTAEAAKESVLSYRTSRRSPRSEEWVAGPHLLVHVDRGEQALPAQLSWRDVEGREAALSFTADMGSFYGHYRAADGSMAETRGLLSSRWAFPGGTYLTEVLRFQTKEGWGGGWHSSGELRLVVDTGDGSPLERLSWRDWAANSASLSLLPDGSGFVGYYQRDGEGAIGFRGDPVGDSVDGEQFWRS